MADENNNKKIDTNIPAGGIVARTEDDNFGGVDNDTIDDGVTPAPRPRPRPDDEHNSDGHHHHEHSHEEDIPFSNEDESDTGDDTTGFTDDTVEDNEVISEEFEPIEDDFSLIDNSTEDEEISAEFGLGDGYDNVIEQTLYRSSDPFSALEVNNDLFQDGVFTEERLSSANQDKRISLGMFSFDDENVLSDEFPDVLRAKKFKQTSKPNLVPNPQGRAIKSVFINKFETDNPRERFFIPEGGWGYCTYDAVGPAFRKRSSDLYGPVSEDSEFQGYGNFIEDRDNGEAFIKSFTNGADSDYPYEEGLDNHDVQGYAGYYPYFFDYRTGRDINNSLIRLQYNLITGSFFTENDPAGEYNLCNKFFTLNQRDSFAQSLGELPFPVWFEEFDFNDSGNIDGVDTGSWESNNRPDISEYLKPYLAVPRETENAFIIDHPKASAQDPEVEPLQTSDFTNSALNHESVSTWESKLTPYKCIAIGRQEPGSEVETISDIYFPNFARWVITDEAYSFNRCLEFLATNYTNGECDFNDDGVRNSHGNTFSWMSDDNMNTNNGGVLNNQYRSLNQVVKIYDRNDENINPFTIMEVKFKMKTLDFFYDTNNPPQVELGIVDGDGNMGSPLRIEDRIGNRELGYYPNQVYWPHGDFNSQRYSDDLNSDDTLDSKYSNFGSMGRFENTEVNKWETFSYKFSLAEIFRYNQGHLRDLYLIIQAAGEFYGRVLLDNFEIYESADFIPEVDVRKKISVGNYGTADLTKYYDKELQPQQYKDSQGPLEAQFYFYPMYPTDKIFDVKRTPVYQDFKKGHFYIYDVNWGDGSKNQFVREPVQIDEETALYHTYESSGVFEITGTMLRMKLNNRGKEIGIIKNKKFKLRININEGTAEDFEYFGSDGFSFIPFKNTLPIIGGISKQSIYYKSLKRFNGFIDDEQTNIGFKSKGDKLKTQIAFDRMDSSFSSNFNLLSEYKKPRFIEVTSTDEIQPFETFLADENLVDFPFDGDGDQFVNAPYFATLPFPRYAEEFDVDNLGTAFFDNNQSELQSGTWANTYYRHDIALMLTFLSYGISIGQSGIEGESSWGYVYPDYARSWNSLSDIPILSNPSSEIIYNGIQTNSEELGKSIGDCDLTNVKYYNEPKSIWELFGFEEDDLEQIAKPDNPRYWKNIIPEDYSIFNREGLDGIIVDTYSEQEWLDDYYYPVLPKYNQNGRFSEDDFPNNKIPFPLQGQITDENETNQNLIINITREQIEPNTFSDNSGNQNLGFGIVDYKPEFDNETLQPKKKRSIDLIKSSTNNGAF